MFLIGRVCVRPAVVERVMAALCEQGVEVWSEGRGAAAGRMCGVGAVPVSSLGNS